MVAITPFILAVSGIFGLCQASPLPAPVEERAVAYRDYRGDGTVAQGWPAVSAWKDFETL